MSFQDSAGFTNILCLNDLYCTQSVRTELEDARQQLSSMRSAHSELQQRLDQVRGVQMSSDERGQDLL